MDNPSAIEVLIGNIGQWITAVAGYMGSFATTVTSNAVLTLAVVAVPLTGVGVSLFRRALHS